MHYSNTYYKELLTRFIIDEVSSEEIKQLYTFIQDEPDTYDAFMQQDDIRALVTAQSNTVIESLSEESNRKIKANIMAYAASTFTINDQPNSYYKLRKWYSVAAAAIILLGLGLYFLYFESKQPLPLVVKTPKEIVAPANNRAMITLANGTQLLLDSLGNGQLAQVGNVKLLKQANGRIAYEMDGVQASGEMQYNALTNPRGSKVIDMRLSDGSHVWLNAESSITYPVAFAGDERHVELKGEGYFEVAKDPTKKFIVTANGTTTEVLGTHFNVNAYTNNATTKITLLEGVVRAAAGSSKVLLRPGQQAQVAQTGLQVFNDADIDQTMAWKNGAFNFDNLPLEEAMHLLERWYDIDVVYSNGIPDIHFEGEIDNNVSLADLLKILGKTKLKFSIEENRKLVITK